MSDEHSDADHAESAGYLPLGRTPEEMAGDKAPDSRVVGPGGLRFSGGWMSGAMDDPADSEPDRTQEYGQGLELCKHCDRYTRRPGETTCRTCRLERADVDPEDQAAFEARLTEGAPDAELEDIADQAHADVTAVQDALGGGPAPLTFSEWVAAGRPTRPRGEDGELVPRTPAEGEYVYPPRDMPPHATTAAAQAATEVLEGESAGAYADALEPVLDQLSPAGRAAYERLRDLAKVPWPRPLASAPGPMPGDRRSTIAGIELFDGRNWRRVPEGFRAQPYTGDRVFPETSADVFAPPLGGTGELGSAVASVLEAWDAIGHPGPGIISDGWRRDDASLEFRALFDALDVLREVGR